MSTVVQAKGQITLPKEARDELGVSPGDTLTWVRNDEGVWEIWKLEDLLDSLAPTMAEYGEWSRSVKKGYNPKRSEA